MGPTVFPVHSFHLVLATVLRVHSLYPQSHFRRGSLEKLGWPPKVSQLLPGEAGIHTQALEPEFST